ncbi:hypothetical protein H4582DRAFT_1326152 [Lactarius indigo]|nr:hypothetical protein H4582DRAFT_1326152 [Lactarius indigo]
MQDEMGMGHTLSRVIAYTTIDLYFLSSILCRDTCAHGRFLRINRAHISFVQSRRRHEHGPSYDLLDSGVGLPRGLLFSAVTRVLTSIRASGNFLPKHLAHVFSRVFPRLEEPSIVFSIPIAEGAVWFTRSFPLSNAHVSRRQLVARFTGPYSGDFGILLLNRAAFMLLRLSNFDECNRATEDPHCEGHRRL